MNPKANRNQQLLRELQRTALAVRSRVIPEDRRLRMRDVYTLCFEVARELEGRYSDLRIMVGDRAGDHGLVQHHWIEIPSVKVYVDPARDVLDPFQPVRVGNTSDADFASNYLNGIDGSIDVNDPRNRPEVLFKARSAWDSEA